MLFYFLSKSCFAVPSRHHYCNAKQMFSQCTLVWRVRKSALKKKKKTIQLPFFSVVFLCHVIFKNMSLCNESVKILNICFTWACTSKPRPLLSENIRLMMLFSMVPRKVLMPNTSAQSSLVSDEAIWKLRTHDNISRLTSSLVWIKIMSKCLV